MKQGWLLDMDGTLWLGEQPIEGACEFVRSLQQGGWPFALFTNNSSRSRRSYVQKARSMGFEVSEQHILTSAMATMMCLRNEGISRILLLATADVQREFQENNFELCVANPQAVVLAFDTELNYAKLLKAHRALLHGVPWYATHPDLVCPHPEGSLPDCGSMIELLASSTKRRPVVIGKPQAPMAMMAAQLLDRQHEDLLIVGDRLYTDMQMGAALGMRTILVLSGETQKQAVQNSRKQPDRVVNSVAELLPELEIG